MRRLHPSNSVLLSIVLVGIVYVATLLLLPAEGFWVIDNANKFLQVKAAVASNYTDYSIPWPGREIDPDFRYKPIPDPFSYVDGGKMFSFYPPFFATLSSFLFRAFGFRGLCLLPMVSSLLMLAGLAAIARRMNRGVAVRHVAVLIVGLCTPIWFYSVVFWEHTIAVCLAIWAISFYLGFIKSNSGRDLVLGSTLAALGIYFRDELYLFCAVLAVFAYFRQKPRGIRTLFTAGAATVLTLLPLWLFQWKTIGLPLGHHVGGLLSSEGGIRGHFAGRPRVLYDLFINSTPHHWLSLLAGGPLLIAFLVNPRISRQRLSAVVAIVAAVALACSMTSLMGYFTSVSAIGYMIDSCNSFLVVAPVLVLAFLRLRTSNGAPARAQEAAQIWTIALAYSVAYGLLAPNQASFGMHWGNRFLLGLYPLFGLLAAANLTEWARAMGRRADWRHVPVVLVVLLSFAAQVYSIEILRKKEDFSLRLNQELAKRPETIVFTNLWWVPSEICLGFSNKAIFLARTDGERDGLMQTLGAKGYKDLLFITKLPDAEAKAAVATVDDKGLNFFTLRFLPIELRPR